jgi:hypothetical protein
MLRSDAWIVGDDEAALEHRAALRSAGLEVDPGGGRPVIGIANSASEFNPCNLPLRDLLPAVRAGVRAAGGIPVEFPVISLGEHPRAPGGRASWRDARLPGGRRPRRIGAAGPRSTGPMSRRPRRGAIWTSSRLPLRPTGSSSSR